MTLRTFIDRPILSGVLSVLVVLLGVIGLVQLPVEQFPEIAPPTVRVSATYTGANAETVQRAVVVPLEEAINGVENINYMTSSATNNGSATVTVYFRAGTDADGGDGQLRRHAGGQLGGDGLQDHGEGAGLFHGMGVL